MRVSPKLTVEQFQSTGYEAHSFHRHALLLAGKRRQARQETAEQRTGQVAEQRQQDADPKVLSTPAQE